MWPPFDPPALPNAGKMARLKGRSSKLEHYGRGRDLSVVERPGFLRMGQRWGHYLPLRKHRWGWPGCGCCSCSGHLVVASVPKRSQILARLLRARETPRMTTHEA